MSAFCLSILLFWNMCEHLIFCPSLATIRLLNCQNKQIPHFPKKKTLTESSTLETAAVILSIAMLTPTAEGTGPTVCGPLNCGISKKEKNQD